MLEWKMCLMLYKERYLIIRRYRTNNREFFKNIPKLAFVPKQIVFVRSTPLVPTLKPRRLPKQEDIIIIIRYHPILFTVLCLQTKQTILQMFRFLLPLHHPVLDQSTLLRCPLPSQFTNQRHTLPGQSTNQHHTVPGQSTNQCRS